MTLEELQIKISADIKDLKNELEKGKKEVEDFGKSSETSMDKFQNGLNKAQDIGRKAFATISTAIAGTVTALVAVTKSTEEYRENQAKLNTAFEAAGASADVAKQVYNDLYRVLGEDDVAVEAAGHLAQMTTNQQALSEWTTICQGVYATFGDSLPIEGLTEAANETAKVGTVTGTLADAINWTKASNAEWAAALGGNQKALAAFNGAIEEGASKEDAFNEALAACNDEAEREELIRTTLNDLYSETAEVYEKNAADILAQNEANASLNESLAKIGEALQPLLTAFAEMGAEIAEKLAPEIQKFVDEHGAELKEMLEKIAEVVTAVLGFIIDNWDTIAKISVAILAIVAAIELLNAVLTVYSMVQMLANSSMSAAVLVIMAVAAAVILIITYWDDIKNAAQIAGEAIKNAFSGMGEWFGNIAEKIKNAFKDIGSWFKEKFTTAKNGITDAFKDIGSWFEGIKKKITDSFNDIGSKLGSKFSEAAQKIQQAFSKIPEFFKNIYNGIKATFDDIATKIGDGLTKGVKKAVNSVLDKAVDVINAAIAGINGAIEFMNMIPGVNIGRINPMKAPQLAKGGIIESATLAVVGEAGKEAVVPLENNLGWLDKLAGMLNERMGGTQPIVLTVDGKVLGEVTTNSINNLTRQTGKLNLIMA